MTATKKPQRVDWLKTHIDSLTVRRLLSIEAEWIYDRMRLHSAAMGTDGRVPKADLAAALDRKLAPKKAERLVLDELVRRELIEATDDAWEIVGWLDEQPSAEDWSDPVKRERWARGKRLQRNEALCRQIKERDHNRCRYCGIRVDWAARGKNAHHAGTYDHVDPDSDNAISNVVVACRGCNMRKSDRTLARARMALLAPGTAEHERQGSPPGSPRADPEGDPRPSSGVDSLACARESYGPGHPEADPGLTSPAHPEPARPPRSGGDL